MARRKSAFQEVGLPGAGESGTLGTSKRDRPQGVRFASKDDVRMFERHDIDDLTSDDYDTTKPIGGRIMRRQPSYRAQATNPMIHRVGAALLVLVGLVPLLSSVGVFRRDVALPIQGVHGGPIPDGVRARREVNLEKRADSATSWCFKWAMQCMLQAVQSLLEHSD